MKKASLLLAVCAGLVATYVLGRWISMSPENGNVNDFVVWRDDLSPDGSVSTEWAFFIAPDFPTGKCEILFDMPMSTIGLALLGISTVSGCVCLKSYWKQIREVVRKAKARQQNALKLQAGLGTSSTGFSSKY